MARTATAAAVAGLVAVAAAWFGTGSPEGVRLPAQEGAGPVAAQAAVAVQQWQASATDTLGVPEAVREAASAVEIAVVDTGADVSAPELAALHPRTYDVLTNRAGVTDTNGHGTLVASVAAAAGGEARLLIVKASNPSGLITTWAEAAAIRYAVDHGARIVNLSFAGTATTGIERAAIRYAVRHGVLLVAAAGNAYLTGNPVEYPAALLQPLGSAGRGGAGLVVGASTPDGVRAPFSSSGSWISLAAPGVQILGALSRLSSPTEFPRAPAASGLVGYGSGTSFAAPQVSGAAALVWSANPALTARQVADILEQTASGHGAWTPDLGYGVIDVAAAVALAAEAG